jgi:small multidrug resistance family-3 protein
MLFAKTVLLFVVTAVAEILGCYLAYLWLRQQRSALLVIPGALSLALFAWLLTLHPTGASRTYAAYGGVYVVTAILWLWIVEGQVPQRWDLVGGAVALAGMSIIAFAPR